MSRRLIATVCVLALIAAAVVSLSSYAQTSRRPGAPQPGAAQQQDTPKLNTDTVSYVLGYNIGSSFKTQGVQINAEVMYEGIQAGLGEKEARLNEKQMKRVLELFQRQLMQKRAAERAAEARRQKQASTQFLEQNKSKPGVKVTDSGLQYKVVEPGNGPSPGPNDRVVVHFTGTLVDGKQFDTSRARGKPIEFQVGRVIPGWTEGLQLMNEGGRYKLFIPAKLAYGETGRQGQIPGNAALIFDVELLEVKRGPGETTGQQREGSVGQ